MHRFGDIYSPALAVAMGLGALGVLLIALARSRGQAVRGRVWLTGGIAIGCAILSLTAGLFSHVLLGHRPGTPEALGIAGFVQAHPAAAVTMIALVAGALFAKRMGRS